MFPGETILSGASKVCDCGTPFEWEIMQSGAGYYIGTMCHNKKCPDCGIPNSRETEYMTYKEAITVLGQWNAGNYIKARY